MGNVPPFCAGHLLKLELWIAARAAQRRGQGDAWLEWARWRAAEVQEAPRMMLGERAFMNTGATVHAPR
jgi:hypothetical protein